MNSMNTHVKGFQDGHSFCEKLAFSILFYSAGVYWIYILSILPSYLGHNFHYTPILKKKWQYTTSSRDELENMLPSEICTPRPSRLPQGAYFPIHSSSWQCIITIFNQTVYFLKFGEGRRKNWNENTVIAKGEGVLTMPRLSLDLTVSQIIEIGKICTYVVESTSAVCKDRSWWGIR